MDVNDFAEQIYLSLPYEPNHQQVQLIAALAHFCAAQQQRDSVFLLTGFAGTGKTSLCGALVRALHMQNIPVVLMAPTGRAAKVFGAFAKHPATTIHRRIYRSDSQGALLSFSSEVADNAYTNAVFIVDEASMIGPDSNSASDSNLLHDLIQYVYSGQDCKLILIGDTAQLPPVGCSLSPALNPDALRQFGLHVTRTQLTSIVRQHSKSGILFNATLLRKAMQQSPLPQPKIYGNNFNDVTFIPGYELQDHISTSIANVGLENTIVITRSNKRAVQFNLAIRNSILDREEELTRGERLMVAKNNYLFSAKIKHLDFIANGDMVTLVSILGTEEKYGLRFADVVVNLTYRNIDIPCKIILNTLTSDSPSLPNEDMAKLYNAVLNDPELFSPATPMRTRMRLLRSNPYFNALQVKYAYAVTCHKAQGGQWPVVYIDMANIAPDAYTTLDFYRWLYTAITRASNSINFANPPQKLIDTEIE